jgi:hypothetical protein
MNKIICRSARGKGDDCAGYGAACWLRGVTGRLSIG